MSYQNLIAVELLRHEHHEDPFNDVLLDDHDEHQHSEDESVSEGIVSLGDLSNQPIVNHQKVNGQACQSYLDIVKDSDGYHIVGVIATFRKRLRVEDVVN